MIKACFRLLVISLVGIMLSACGGTYEWNQKLTVKVQTPDGEKTAYSVMQARLIDTHGPFVPAEANGVSFQLSGEAVTLEVAPGRYLFALLKGVPSLSWLAYPKMDSAKAGALLEKGDDGGTGVSSLVPSQYPLLVTFDDINDPNSVKRVDPTNLEAAFGAGYDLNSITLSLSHEPVTKGQVKKWLGWWKNYTDKRERMISLRYPNASPRGFDTLSPLDFWSLDNIPQKEN